MIGLRRNIMVLHHVNQVSKVPVRRFIALLTPHLKDIGIHIQGDVLTIGTQGERCIGAFHGVHPISGGIDRGRGRNRAGGLRDR
jgi:hypothetical protein